MTVCDFCDKSLEHGFSYPCADFTVNILILNPQTGREKEVNWTSTGEWLACDMCSVLIDLKAWTQLAEATASNERIIGPRIILYQNFNLMRTGEKQKF
jgi:hypothetical protein